MSDEVHLSAKLTLHNAGELPLSVFTEDAFGRGLYVSVSCGPDGKF